MMGNMRIKAKEKDGVVKTKVQIKHVMMTYAQAKQKAIDVNFVTHIIAKVEQRVVYELSSSQFISKNPILKFTFLAQKGDVLEITWTDISGQSVTESKKIK